MSISDQMSAREGYRELLLHARFWLVEARKRRLAGDRAGAHDCWLFGRAAHMAAISFPHLPREHDRDTIT